MALFKQQNVEDFYDIGEELGRYGLYLCHIVDSPPRFTKKLIYESSMKQKCYKNYSRQ